MTHPCNLEGNYSLLNFIDRPPNIAVEEKKSKKKLGRWSTLPGAPYETIRIENVTIYLTINRWPDP